MAAYRLALQLRTSFTTAAAKIDEPVHADVRYARSARDLPNEVNLSDGISLRAVTQHRLWRSAGPATVASAGTRESPAALLMTLKPSGLAATVADPRAHRRAADSTGVASEAARR